MHTIKVKPIYGPIQKLPGYPGDPNPTTKLRNVYAPYTKIKETPTKTQLHLECYAFEITEALEKEGFHVHHPTIGRYATTAAVFLPLHKPLPKEITIRFSEAPNFNYGVKKTNI